jgi:HYR domain
VKRSLLAFVLGLFAVSATAGTITSINPSMVKVNSGEHFLAINGSGLGSVVVFQGPAGTFERNTSANFSGTVHVWVPESVVRTSGLYNVWVKGGTGDSNVVQFEVRGFKFFPFVIITPEVLRAQPLNREGGTVKYNVFWAGGESDDGSVDCFPASGDFFKMGVTTVKCSGRNSAGEQAEASFTVEVIDQVAPKLEVPREPIIVKWTQREGAVVEFDVKAYDDIYGDLVPECTPKSGSMFPVGITNVQCNATDADLNIGHASFVVEVVGELKPYELTVKVPKGIYVDARSAEGEIIDYKVGVSGTEDPSPEVNCVPKPGSRFPVGTTEVVCDAIDRWGMRGRGIFPVEVRDTKPPFFEKLYATPDVLENDGEIYRLEVAAVASDEIDRAPVCSIFAVTSNQDIHLGDDDSDKEYDWKITGDLTLELRGEAIRVERYYDVWVGCQDFFGNRVNGTARVRVPTGSGQSEPAPTTPSKRRAGPKG